MNELYFGILSELFWLLPEGAPIGGDAENNIIHASLMYAAWME